MRITARGTQTGAEVHDEPAFYLTGARWTSEPRLLPNSLHTPRYLGRFASPALACELIARTSIGNVVVDREVIRGLADGSSANCLAVYEIDTSRGLITDMKFVWEPIADS